MKKKVLIIGGTSDIGHEIAIAFAKNNYDVIISYFNNLERANEIERELISKYNVDVMIYKCDITKQEDINDFYNAVLDKYGNIDVLINSACLCMDNYYLDKDKSEFMQVLEVNLVGPFLVIQKFANIVLDTIINIASTDGIDTFNPYSIDYCASKAGLINMTMNLALVLEVRILGLALNYVDTDSVNSMDRTFLNSELKRIGQEKLIKKEEVAPEGSLKYYQNKISENKAKIELSIDPKERVKLQKEIDGYKFEINRINFNDSAIANGNTLKDAKDIIYEMFTNIKVPPIEIPINKNSFNDLEEALNELGAPMNSL